MTGDGERGEPGRAEARTAAWSALAAGSLPFYRGPEPGTAGEGWFAALSGQPNAELNVAGLTDRASAASAQALLAALGPDRGAVVFTAEDADRTELVAAGFEQADEPEPLMWLTTAPRPVLVGDLRVTRGGSDSDIALAVDVMSRTHHVPPEQVDASIGEAARSGAATPWLAWVGDDPVSSMWLVRVGPCLGVHEMMTPPEHQRRGAGRTLLSTALAEQWDATVDAAVLLSTAAGRRLYESLGFTAVDEVITCYRGVDDEVLAAIGQPT